MLQFIHDQISPNTYVNIMSQYRPCGRAARELCLNRPLTLDEYQEALEMAGSVNQEKEE